jgi:hypothetical protein
MADRVEARGVPSPSSIRESVRMGTLLTSDSLCLDKPTSARAARIWALEI